MTVNGVTQRNRWPVLAPSLRGYRRAWLRGDLVAGLTLWSVLVPESLAYATIAGVSPVVGLYAAPLALAAYAVLGSSRQLVVGPMSASAALSAATVAGVAVTTGGDRTQLTAALAVTVGVVALCAGLLRLGFIAGWISEPVLKGFVIGLALTIVVGQLPALCGVDKSDGNAFGQLWGLLGRLDEIHGSTFAVGAASLTLVLLLRRYLPLVPAALAAVLLGVLAAVVLHLADGGVDVVGPIASGLPAVGLPDVPGPAYLGLTSGAVGITLVGFAEGLGAAKTYAAESGDPVDADRELIGVGAANLASGLSSGMVVNGSLSKTAVNAAAGARSQVSGLVVAGLTVITLLFLTGLFEQLPEATLAAVVIAAVIDLVDIPALARLHRLWTARLGSIYGPTARADFLAAVAALAGVLVFGTLPGLFVGVGVSMLLLIYRASRPNLTILGRDPADGDWVDAERDPRARSVPGVAVVRVEGGLFFANADHLREQLRTSARTAGADVLVLDLSAAPVVDVTAAQMLVDLACDLDRQDVRFVIARDLGQVRDVLDRTQPDGGLPTTYPTVDAAIADLTAT